ncbi:MAG: hypothetical protein ABSG55_08515 [Dehalococcoidia bacterium]|jgi:hypothetical protein
MMSVSEENGKTVVRQGGMVWRVEPGKEEAFEYVRGWLLRPQRMDAGGAESASEETRATATMDATSEAKRARAASRTLLKALGRRMQRMGRRKPIEGKRRRREREKLGTPAV